MLYWISWLISYCLIWQMDDGKKTTPPEPNEFVHFISEQTFYINPNSYDTIQLDFQVSEGFHIISNEKSEQYISSQISFRHSEDILVGTPIFPKPIPYQIEGGIEDLMIFQGPFSILLPLEKIEKVFEREEWVLKGSLKYQACDDRKCYFPRELAFSACLIVI